MNDVIYKLYLYVLKHGHKPSCFCYMEDSDEYIVSTYPTYVDDDTFSHTSVFILRPDK